MKRITTLLLAFALAVPAFGQNDVRAQFINEIIAALDLKALVGATYDVVMAEPDLSELEPPAVTPEEKAKADESRRRNVEARRAYRERVLSRINYEHYANAIYRPMLAKTFSTEELQELAAFLKTETGKKTSVLIPELATAISVRVGPMLQADLQKIGRDLDLEDKKKNPWKVTVTDMYSFTGALDMYAIDHDKYPDTDIAGLPQVLAPYLEGSTLPMKDVWGTTLYYVSDGPMYRLVSAGADKRFEQGVENIDPNAKGKESPTLASDIILQNGTLLQWPAADAK